MVEEGRTHGMAGAAGEARGVAVRAAGLGGLILGERATELGHEFVHLLGGGEALLPRSVRWLLPCPLLPLGLGLGSLARATLGHGERAPQLVREALGGPAVRTSRFGLCLVAVGDGGAQALARVGEVGLGLG